MCMNSSCVIFRAPGRASRSTPHRALRLAGPVPFEENGSVAQLPVEAGRRIGYEAASRLAISVRRQSRNVRSGFGPAPVAQLDRALPSEGRGHRFESCRVRHFINKYQILGRTRVDREAALYSRGSTAEACKIVGFSVSSSRERFHWLSEHRTASDCHPLLFWAWPQNLIHKIGGASSMTVAQRRYRLAPHSKHLRYFLR
jgi:hypothetical protein